MATQTDKSQWSGVLKDKALYDQLTEPNKYKFWKFGLQNNMFPIDKIGPNSRAEMGRYISPQELNVYGSATMAKQTQSYREYEYSPVQVANKKTEQEKFKAQAKEQKSAINVANAPKNPGIMPKFIAEPKKVEMKGSYESPNATVMPSFTGKVEQKPPSKIIADDKPSKRIQEVLMGVGKKPTKEERKQANDYATKTKQGAFASAFWQGVPGGGALLSTNTDKKAIAEGQAQFPKATQAGAITGGLTGQGLTYALVSPAIAATKVGQAIVGTGKTALGAFAGKQALELGIDVAIQTPQEVVKAISNGSTFGDFAKSWGENMALSVLFNGVIGGGAEGIKAFKNTLSSADALKALSNSGIDKKAVTDAFKALDSGNPQPLKQIADDVQRGVKPRADIPDLQVPGKRPVYVNPQGTASKSLAQAEMPISMPDTKLALPAPTQPRVIEPQVPVQPTVQPRGVKPIQERSFEEVGNRSVKAYQFENPEVKPFYKEQAQELLGDLKDTQGGRKTFVEDETGYKFGGENRITSDLIADIKDSTKASYAKIKEAIEKIIKDNGLENNALSKRIEMIIDDSLVKGYTDFNGMKIPPNAEYINVKNALDGVQSKQFVNPEFDAWAKNLTGKQDFTPQEIDGLKRVYENQTGKSFDAVEPFDFSAKVSKEVPRTITPNELAEQRLLDLSDRVRKGEVSQAEAEMVAKQLTDELQAPKPVEAHDMSTLEGRLKAFGDESRTTSMGAEMNIPKAPETSVDLPSTPKIDSEPNVNSGVKYDDSVLKTGQKYRQTIANSLENSEVDEAVKQELRDSPEIYDAINNQTTWDNAFSKVQENAQKSLDEFNAKSSLTGAEDTAEAIALIHKFANEGNTSQAVQVSRDLAEKATRSGQAVQAIVMLQRTTPEGQLYRATRTIKQVEDAIKKSDPVKYKKFKDELDKFPEMADELRNKYKIPNLSDAEADEIIKRMNDAQNLEGRPRDIEIARVEQLIANKIPSTFRDKVIAIRNLSLLFNPKTLLTRNPLGNVIFSGLENVAQIPSGITDKMLSSILKTQRQTKIIPNLKAQALGLKKGTLEAIEDARLNIDTSPTRGGVELPRNRKLFETAWLNKPNNWLSNALQFGDRPFYQAAYDARLQDLIDLQPNANKTELEALAREFGLEKVFQNDSQTSKAVSKLKGGINDIVNVKGFGLGDVVMPYTQTPSNILAKGLEYTPLNILNIGKKISDFKRLGTGQAQKQLTDTIGRTFTGAGIIALGYNLAKNGDSKTTGKAPKTEKERKLWEAQGKRNYSIKIGDKWYSYDWAQPASMPLALGVDFYNSIQDTDVAIAKAIAKLENENEKANPVRKEQIKREIDDLKDGQFLKAAESGFTSAGDTIFKQGMLQGITRMFGGTSPATGVGEAVIGIPTQFVPTLGSQFSQLFDENKRRVDYGGLEGVKQQMQAKTPLRQNMPIKQNMLGEPIKESTGEITPQKVIETFISPSLVSRDTNNQVLKEIERLIDVTNELDTIPYKMPSSANTPEKEEQFTAYYGPLVNKELSKLIKSPSYKSAKDVKKADLVTKVIDKVYKKAKSDLFD